MKKQIHYIFLLLMSATLISCDKEEANPKYKTGVTVRNTYAQPVQDATVYFFSSESDYLLDVNPVKQSSTDGQGQVSVENDQETAYWVRVEKGNLNSLRSKKNKTSSTITMDGVPYYNLETTLSTTPTKLQLNVKNAGNAVEGATVQLYYSEDDYTNNITPYNRQTTEVRDTYGSTIPVYPFAGTTSADGSVFFDNLEPRQYWFKITKDNMSNASTTISTGTPLSDDENVTRTLDVGIN